MNQLIFRSFEADGVGWSVLPLRPQPCIAENLFFRPPSIFKKLQPASRSCARARQSVCEFGKRTASTPSF